jgi:hypothetical protein
MTWYQIGSRDPAGLELQRCNTPLTSTSSSAELCARGDLNRRQPTLVVPELASLSVK